MKKRALISVFDKTNILEFSKSLVEMDWEIVSTGGTFNYLNENGIDVIEISQVTNFPEILEGRVKTLNPYIHGGILFKREEKTHQDTITKENITPIDMVVNNLYPFEEKLKENCSHEEMIENIDIGGPSMIRAAAKNYKDVLIITNPDDYEDVLEDLRNGEVSLDKRVELSKKAFSYTTFYDSLISNYFNKITNEEYPKYKTFGYKLENTLRYGENPHQSAAHYKDVFNDIKLKKLNGKELSYNNLRDIYCGVKIVKDFKDPTVVAIKHNNPCGIGSGDNIYNAYMKAFRCDTESIFGGIVVFNREVDEKSAEHMNSYFLEIIIAPKFSKKALEILTNKKNLRLIEIEDFDNIKFGNYSINEVIGGIVYQQEDYVSKNEENFDFEIVTENSPTKNQIEDLKFAWRCAKNVASNGVVIAKNQGTIGIGQGEVRRSWAVEEAIKRAGEKIEDSVIASDGFFFEDTVEEINKANIKAVISPGGSVKDEKVIELCNKYNISLVFTGTRHFRH